MTVFDIIGPVMVGPSSSHTAGALRLARVARAVLGEDPVSAVVVLHGSFAKTYKGHGTDRAIIGGLLGMDTDDERIRSAPEIARAKGIEVRFSTVELEEVHPNTVRIELTADDGHKASIQGSSVGGGSIEVSEINGMPVHYTAQHPCLIVRHRDAPGMIAKVTETVARSGSNICNIGLARREKGGEAVMTIELDDNPRPELARSISTLDNVYSVAYLEAM